MDCDIVNVGRYKNITIKTKKGQMLEYKYEQYREKNPGEEMSIIINNSKSKTSFRLEYHDGKTQKVDTITNKIINQNKN